MTGTELQIYADSSVLFSLYVEERFSASADRRLRGGVALPFSALHRLEMASALAQHLGRGTISEREHGQVLALIRMDTESGRLWSIEPDWEAAYGSARDLAARHGPATLARSLDVLHVALALQLGCAELVSSDMRQLRLAELAGLRATDIKR